MITTILLILVVLSLALVSVIIFRHVPYVALVGEGEVRRIAREQPFYKKFIKTVTSQQKFITIALLSKLIRRFKIISLKADNIATKLLIKLKKYGD